MKANTKIYYNKEDDFLEITIGNPKKGYMKNIGRGIFHRVDEKSGKVIGIAIFSFIKRAEKQKEINLPGKLEITS